LPGSCNLFTIDVASKHDVSFILGISKRPNVKVCTGLSFAVLNIVSLTAVEWVLNGQDEIGVFLCKTKSYSRRRILQFVIYFL
jgi:hypothetical protein